MEWVASISTTATFALALWLARNLIETRLTKSVQHEFDSKLEQLRTEFRRKEELFKADLRAKEAEIATLRGGALSAMASRQIALDKRRLEAVDQLWITFTALQSIKMISQLMASFDWGKISTLSVQNEKFRETFTIMGSSFDEKKIDFSGANKARPFLSPSAWAIYSAYQSIAMQAVAKFRLVELGLANKDFLNKDSIKNLVKAALPHQEAYIEEFGDAGYHYLLDELESKLLSELQKMLNGVEADKESIEKAAEIVKLSNAVTESLRQSNLPTENTSR